jgi:hypothetical protein
MSSSTFLLNPTTAGGGEPKQSPTLISRFRVNSPSDMWLYSLPNHIIQITGDAIALPLSCYGITPLLVAFIASYLLD